MKTIYSLAVLVIAIALFAWKKDSPNPKPETSNPKLSGAWYGKYQTGHNSTQKAFVIVLKEKGKIHTGGSRYQYRGNTLCHK